MSSENSTPSGQQGFKDVIVTLPGWGLGVIAALCLCSLALAMGVALLSPSDSLKGAALQLLVVLVPLGSAVIAGIAIRRTSTQQIDRLVTGFLEKTLMERFALRCHNASRYGLRAYPFGAVELLQPCRGTSYVVYQLHWHAADGPARAPVQVGFKCNVFNFEMFAELPVPAPQVAAAGDGASSLSPVILNTATIGQFLDHPVLRHFMGVLQGSVNEGYEIHAKFKPQPVPAPGRAMHLSLRQKLRENFLTSPFLKRYFAEDAAIAVGVLYAEWLLLQAPTAPAAVPEGGGHV